MEQEEEEAGGRGRGRRPAQASARAHPVRESDQRGGEEAAVHRRERVRGGGQRVVLTPAMETLSRGGLHSWGTARTGLFRV